MSEKIKNAAGQLWSDFVACAGIFTSFCGVVSAVISVINACNPGTLSDLPTKVTSKSAAAADAKKTS